MAVTGPEPPAEPSGAHPGPGDVVRVAAGAVHDLRRRVLRGGRADAEVAFPQDERPGAFHLALLGADGRPAAVASLAPEPWPARPGADAWRLRGMAVEPAHQGTGAGARLLVAAEAELAARGAELVWAEARDSAVGFYRRRGWRVVGEGFVGAEGLPHHVVVREGAAAATCG